MKVTAVAFHLTLNDQERGWLMLRIEHYFENAIDGRDNLFRKTGDALLIMDVLHKIKTNSLLVEITWLQAKLLVDVIENSEKRMNCKTWKPFIPKDFDHRDIYDELVKLSQRKI